MFDDKQSSRVALVFIIIISLVVLTPLSPEQVAARLRHKQECTQPKLMSTTPDGLQLWAHNWCDSYPVYFSKQGTGWNESHSNGKTSRIESHNVPSAEQEEHPSK